MADWRRLSTPFADGAMGRIRVTLTGSLDKVGKLYGASTALKLHFSRLWKCFSQLVHNGRLSSHFVLSACKYLVLGWDGDTVPWLCVAYIADNPSCSSYGLSLRPELDLEAYPAETQLSCNILTAIWKLVSVQVVSKALPRCGAVRKIDSCATYDLTLWDDRDMLFVQFQGRRARILSEPALCHDSNKSFNSDIQLLMRRNVPQIPISTLLPSLSYSTPFALYCEVTPSLR